MPVHAAPWLSALPAQAEPLPAWCLGRRGAGGDFDLASFWRAVRAAGVETSHEAAACA